MENTLKKVLGSISERYRDRIEPDSPHYLEVELGRQAEKFGYEGVKDEYRKVGVVVPVKHPEPGMKVMIDGRTFVKYAQMESGIAAPEYVAKDAGMDYTPYIAKESMVLNFT